MRLEADSAPSATPDRFSVDTQALSAAAGRVADSAKAYAEDVSMISGLPAACADTPASSACDDFATKLSTVLADQSEATSSLSQALIDAANAYAAADEYAF